MSFRLGQAPPAPSSGSRSSGMFGAMRQKAEKAAAAASAAAVRGMDAAKAAKGKLSTVAGDSRQALTQGSVSTESVAQLEAMGFSRHEAEAALRMVGGQDVEAASSYLCDDSFRAALQPFGIGSMVEVHGLTSAAGHSLNGRTGRVLEYVESSGRLLVDINGEQKLLRVENLKKTSSSDTMQKQMRASFQGAKASMQDVKRRAEAFLGKPSKSSNSSLSDEASGMRGVQAPVSTAAQRRAVAEAAERRLAEARARNAGTMDDWRRWRAEQARVTVHRPAASAERHEVTSSRSSPVSAQMQGTPQARAEIDADEDEDLQRALAASMSHTEKDSVNAKVEDPELQAALEASLASLPASREAGESTEATADAKTKTAAWTGSSCAAAATDEDVDDADGETAVAPTEDPELFELMLKQALAEEELELQMVLASSIEAERLALEKECAAAEAAEAAETAESVQGLGDASFATPPRKCDATGMESQDVGELDELEKQLAERRKQELNLRQEQIELEARVAQLRTEVASREATPVTTPECHRIVEDRAAASSESDGRAVLKFSPEPRPSVCTDKTSRERDSTELIEQSGSKDDTVREIVSTPDPSDDIDSQQVAASTPMQATKEQIMQGPSIESMDPEPIVSNVVSDTQEHINCARGSTHHAESIEKAREHEVESNARELAKGNVEVLADRNDIGTSAAVGTALDDEEAKLKCAPVAPDTVEKTLNVDIERVVEDPTASCTESAASASNSERQGLDESKNVDKGEGVVHDEKMIVADDCTATDCKETAGVESAHTAAVRPELSEVGKAEQCDGDVGDPQLASVGDRKPHPDDPDIASSNDSKIVGEDPSK
eukprot:TRINITY_DN18931_c0_g2_i1.p1 TRINITY_DN18931_c0_g2~~TRINITY_DN18931_c0_g2_i1.p1  ORF type:complete len:843 (+),score=165.16 TRINITY_DN18931_c0_g2_i1:50-2578(+)